MNDVKRLDRDSRSPAIFFDASKEFCFSRQQDGSTALRGQSKGRWEHAARTGRQSPRDSLSGRQQTPREFAVMIQGSEDLAEGLVRAATQLIRTLVGCKTSVQLSWRPAGRTRRVPTKSKIQLHVVGEEIGGETVDIRRACESRESCPDRLFGGCVPAFVTGDATITGAGCVVRLAPGNQMGIHHARFS
jgi:hypothetical protein